MSGYITEFFGYRADDTSDCAKAQSATRHCPFLNEVCPKRLSRERIPSGVCAVRQASSNAPTVICCPNRLYADDYRMLRCICKDAFHVDKALYGGKTAVERAKVEDGAVAVFGKQWGGELRLPQREGAGSYFVDWVLVLLDGEGKIREFTAVEVQTVDTTGNYHPSRQALVESRQMVKSTVGINWENVSKRIIPQLIYKGQVLQREDLCRAGLYFVCPDPVFDRVLRRLGGTEKIPAFPSQPASIHFVSYDYDMSKTPENGTITPLNIRRSLCTTVYKVQEAFSSMTLPEGNVYRRAIEKSLYG
ncbi:MAG: restriction endonuclease [Kiritimatiellae bacterium]|nr:restriction endonuclease [Kiritimatiellia bacterium]